MAKRKSLAKVLALIMSLSMLAGTAEAAGVGVMSHTAEGRPVNTAISQTKQVNAKWLRDSIQWVDVENIYARGEDGSYTQKGTHQLPFNVNWVTNAKEEGINTIVLLSYGNPMYLDEITDVSADNKSSWSVMPKKSSDKTDGWQEYYDAYLAYVNFVSTQLKGQVTAYEIGNEPDIESFNILKAPASQYAQLLKDSYNIIKSNDPNALVLGGAIATDTVYLDGILDNLVTLDTQANDGKKSMDALSVHYYLNGETPEERTETTLEAYYDVLEKYDTYKNVPIYITETGESSYRTSYDENIQAKRIVRNAILAEDWLKTHNGGEIINYELSNTDNKSNNQETAEYESNLGLFSKYGIEKPGAYAVEIYNKVVGEKEFVSLTENDNTYVAKYQGDSGVAYAVWASEGTSEKTVSVESSGAQTVVYDYLGFVQESTTETIAVSDAPIFIECNNVAEEASGRKTVPNEKLLYEQNFDDGDFVGIPYSSGDMKLGEKEADIVTWYNYKSETYMGYDGDGISFAEYNSANERANIHLLLGGVFTTGTYKLTAKYMPSTMENGIILEEITTANHIIMTIDPTESLERDWYDLEFTVSLDADLAEVKISKGGVVLFEKSQSCPVNLMDIGFLQRGNTEKVAWSDENSGHLDDIRLVKIGDYSLEKSDIIIKDSEGNRQMDWNDVDKTSNIAVKFGVPMTSETINSETVTLKAGTVAVDAEYSYDTSENKLTITPKTDLDDGTEYVLTVTDGAKFKDGNSFASRVGNSYESEVSFSLFTKGFAKVLSVTPQTADGTAMDSVKTATSKLAIEFDTEVLSVNDAISVTDANGSLLKSTSVSGKVVTAELTRVPVGNISVDISSAIEFVETANVEFLGHETTVPVTIGTANVTSVVPMANDVAQSGVDSTTNKVAITFDTPVAAVNNAIEILDSTGDATGAATISENTVYVALTRAPQNILGVSIKTRIEFDAAEIKKLADTYKQTISAPKPELAEVTVTAVQNAAEENKADVTITGKIANANEKTMVSISVLPKFSTIDEIATLATVSKAYAKTIESEEDGTFTASFTVNGQGEKYIITVGAAGIATPYTEEKILGKKVNTASFENVEVTIGEVTDGVAEVTVTGIANPDARNKLVSVSMLPGSVIFTDLSGRTLTGDGYIGLTTADTDGTFTTTFKMSAVGKTYTLKLNGEGIKTPYNSTVVVGDRGTAFLTAELNGIKLASFDDLKVGDKVKIIGEYTGEGDAKLIYAVYSGDRLSDVKIETTTEGKAELEFTYTNEAITSIKAFLWDSLTTLKPLHKNVTVE